MKTKFKLEFGGSDIIDWRIPEQKEKLLRNLLEWAGKSQSSCPSAERGGKGGASRKITAAAARKAAAMAAAEAVKAAAGENGKGLKGRGRAPVVFHSRGDVRRLTVAGVRFALRWIPGKGGPAGFWMGETQVTQQLWVAVMGNLPFHFGSSLASSVKKYWASGALTPFAPLVPPVVALAKQKFAKRNVGDQPVERVSWNDCGRFLEKLNADDAVRSAGLVFRLPSEEEWERACRAGSDGRFCKLADGTEITADSLGRVAWFNENSGGASHPVGEKEPNAWGLHDMHGNVWEWTQTSVRGKRVCRGGSWFSSADSCGASFRDWNPPSSFNEHLGFRLCASDGKR